MNSLRPLGDSNPCCRRERAKNYYFNQKLISNLGANCALKPNFYPYLASDTTPYIVKVSAFATLDRIPSVSVTARVIPLPIWKLCNASFIAPPAIETSKAKALLSSYVEPPWSWKSLKVAAEPLVFAMIIRPISVFKDAVYKVAALVSDGLACPKSDDGA
ncbi:hypothetical protein [uncultured Mediterranean phage uvMED]|nr:hypothetical protein [uncultured Mediterranean phage uvMED]